MAADDERGSGPELVTGAQATPARRDCFDDVQQRLHEHEELYRYVIELHGLIPWTADANGSIVGVGRRWKDLTGAAPATGLGEGWMGFIHPDDRERVAKEWGEAVRSGDRLRISYRVLTTEGSYRWCEAKTRKRLDGGTQPAIWYGTLEDVHERHLAEESHGRLQEELIQVSRLNAVGAMASVIAHDLNQPLTAATSYLRGAKRLLGERKGSRYEVIDALDEADRAVVRSADIVRQMRAFLARGEVERRTERLTDILEEACRFALSDAARRGISHSTDFAADCCVLIDRVQVQQVLVNLLRNAVEAVSGTKRRHIKIETRFAGDFQCEVSVSDTGPGIAEEARERLFDPFYTTRRDGMGLGLSIGRMIVEAHGGSIFAEPRPGGGTRMSFTLPAARTGPGLPPEDQPK